MIYLLKLYIQSFLTFAVWLKTGLLLPSISSQESTDKIAMLNNPRNICVFGMPIIEPIPKDSSLVQSRTQQQVYRFSGVLIVSFAVTK